MEEVTLRTMEESDYEDVHALWLSIHGFGMRALDDNRDNILRFIARNPSTSIVAHVNEEVVGTILCGHDGRSAFLYHVCVREDMRRRGIGNAMVKKALQALSDEHINKVSLIAYTNNEVGNLFWKHIGWKLREDVNVYEFPINAENITRFNA